MGWQDTARFLSGVIPQSSFRSTTFRAQGYKTFNQRYSPPRRRDSDRFGAPASTRINWSDMATGRMTPPGSVAPAGPRGRAPGAINVSLPYSSSGSRSPYAPPPEAAPRSTQGDLFASIGQAGEQLFGEINLANAIPYLMERVNVLANDLADSRIPVVSDVARAVDTPLDTFISAFEEVAKPVGQVIDAFPAWVRDSQLKDRAKMYAALARGETPDFGPLGSVSNPIATAAQLASQLLPGANIGTIRSQMGGSANLLAPLTGQTVSEQAWQAKQWQDILLHSVDPQQRFDAQQRMAILRQSIDLPESVKLAIENKPNANDDELARLLDEAPEGKAWSYQPGAPGVLQNMGTSLLFFLAEARAGYATLGALRAPTLALRGRSALDVVRASEIPRVARAAELAGRGLSTTAKLQTAAVAAGLGITATTTTMGAIARYAGADEAIAWFDNANRSTEFSDDPYVQLATGFAVNPIAAAKMARTGVVQLKHGLVDVPIGVATGRRVARFYDSESVIEDMTRRMFKLGSREEAAVFLDEQGLRESAPDRIIGTALDVVLERLPKEERLAWNAMHPDPVERAGATLRRYGQQALDLIEKDPDLVAARFYDYDWNYRMMPGPFNAEVAAKVARDHRNAVEMTYDLRQEQNLVVGYRELLPPKGQALARDRVAQATENGMVPMRVVQDLVGDFPALRKEWGGLVRSTDELIPRAVVDRIIDNAHISWQHAVGRNPIKAATGVDPVLRPSSPTLQRDYADAIGTNVATIKAIEDADTSAAGADLLKRFLVDKQVVDAAAADALTPEEAWSQAAAYLEDTTAPWRAMGERLEGADKQLTRLRAELVRIKREGTSVEHDRTIRVQREINELADLIRLAGDPIRTFASGAERTTGLGDSHLAELAARKVDAMERLRVIATVDDELRNAELSEADLSRIITGADGELTDIYDVLGAPPTPVLDAYLAYRTANMYTIRNKPGEVGIHGKASRRHNVRELSVKGEEFVRYTEEAPGSYQWAQIAESPGFLKRMREKGGEEVTFGEVRMTGDEVADIVEAAALKRGVSGKPIDAVAEAWGLDRQQTLNRLGSLKAAREQALDGKGPAALKRTAAIKVSEDYVTRAEADRAARELVYDAEYEAFWHPRNVAKVDEISRDPDELWEALREVAESDPEVMAAIERVAANAPEPASSPSPGFHAGDLGHGKDTTLDRMTAGRDSGHFGTGVYFVSRPERITGRSTRAVEQVDLSSYRLHRPQGQRAAMDLHDALKMVNDAVHLAPDRPGYVEALRAAADKLARDPGLPAADLAGKVEDAVVAARGDLGRTGYVDSASTRLMKSLGYEGVDVRHIKALDNTGFGTVVYREALDKPAETTSADRVFADPSYADAVRAEVIPPDFEPPVEGLIREHTDLDLLITSGDRDAIVDLAEQLQAAAQQPRPPTRVRASTAERLAQLPKQRRSYNYRRRLSDLDADFKVAPSEKILARAQNKIGVETLSVMNHGIIGTRPATIDGVIALLRDIEDGAATRLGIGPELQAEAQRVARDLLEDAVKQARKDPEIAGAFSKGFFPEDEQALAATIDDLLTFDDANPMGTLQYGLKKAPKAAVVMEWSKVPGLAEELLTGRFQPWEERILTAEARKAWGWVFGPRSNLTIRAETRNRFIERAQTHGVSQETAAEIWKRWAQIAHDSRRPSLRKRVTGRREYEAGDNPLYADVWNIPNDVLDAAVHGDHTGPGVLAELSNVRREGGSIPTAESAAAATVDWAHVFRESASFTRRTLADRLPLGQLIADTYGKIAHNKAVTTMYYWFRFGLDVRYHAMNYLEAQILYLGRAGLRKGEIDEGLLGMSEGYLRNLDLDPTSNTGYVFSRDRMAWAYRTFLKEQPDAIRGALRSVIKEGPEGQRLMEKAMRELAGSDPQLRDMIDAMGHTPEKYLAELDAWHRKMLGSVDEATDASTIDEALRKEMADTPALAEVFDRLGQVNRDLWSDIRATFYGNPNRSRAERVLNSYLLFWPLSYQIKSTKWFAKVLFDKVGGIQTNALGAISLDRMADMHNRLIATDPDYRDWFEKHDTLVFTAQMLFPVSFDQMGVSLNPALRGLFFERDLRRAAEIGPVFTYTRVLRPVWDELEVDVWPTLAEYMNKDAGHLTLGGGAGGESNPASPS